MAKEPNVRWMIRRDMPEVLEIEQASFEFSWTEEDFLRALRQRNCIGMVTEEPGTDKIVGYMIYELHKNHLFILNFAVHPKCRKRGIGCAMIKKLKSKLSSHRRTSLQLAVRESNLDAQLFFRTMGLRATRVLRAYYDGDSGEDAYQMCYSIPVEGVLQEAPANRISQYEEHI